MRIYAQYECFDWDGEITHTEAIYKRHLQLCGFACMHATNASLG